MTQAQLGILLGGIVPAILFGIAGLFQKVSADLNPPLGIHLVNIGIGVVSVGVVLWLMNPSQDINLKAAGSSFVIGAAWGTGMSLVAIALVKYNASLAQITPLYNMNTLVTVAAALFIFSEWKDVKMAKLIAGTICIVIGGILVST